MKKLACVLLVFCLSAAAAAAPARAATWTPDTAVLSSYVYLVNADTGVVLYEKSAEKRAYPASLTKMMTVSLVVDHVKNLDETVTIEDGDVKPIQGTGGSTGGFVSGEQITVRELLFCVMMESANEGANTLARVTAGSADKFVQMMNEKAKQLGCKNTHFVNPHGLHDPEHYSTAYDCYLIARYAMTHQVLREIVATERYLVPATNKRAARTIHNTNFLLNDASPYYYKNCQGIKTGTTTPAGYCLASYAKNSDGETYYCIVMGGPKSGDTNTAFKDTKTLYKWAYGTFNISPLLDKQDIEAQLPLKLAWNNSTLSLYPESQLNSLVPRSADLSKIKVTPHLSAQTAFAPIKNGQRFGTADVYLDGKKIGTVNLVAHDTIARSLPLYFVYEVSLFFHSVWFWVLVVVLVLLFVLFLLFSSRIRIRRKKDGNFLAAAAPRRRLRRRRRRRGRF